MDTSNPTTSPHLTGRTDQIPAPPWEWVKDGPGPYELVPRRNRKARRAAAARARRSR